MNSNYKLTPKKLADYCNGRTCQSECKYNHLCYSVFKLATPADAYALGKSSEEYKKLKTLLNLINAGVPNDIGKIKEMLP
jgi:hypothetical protein